MSAVYVGKDVTVKIQTPVKDENESSKLIKLLHYGVTERVDNKAYYHSASSEPNPPFGVELAGGDYDGILSSDDVRYQYSTSVNGEYAILLLRLKCSIAEADVKKLVVKFEGYGTAPSGNGVTMKIWDHVSSVWGNASSGTAGLDEVLTISLTTNLGNYIDASGYIYVLVRTTNPSDGSTAAVLYCDQAYGFVTQGKFTVDHTPISDLDMDGVADETSHVSVTRNGSAVTVSSVDDSAGEVTLSSGDFNETDVILCTYRYDADPYVAQELTVEPKQRIEGLDGLGSDIVQIWAPLLKEIGGSIKEVYKRGDVEQTSRFIKVEIAERFYNDDDWEVLSGSWSIVNGEYRGQGIGKTLLKPYQLQDFHLQIKFYGDLGWFSGVIFRYQDSNNYYECGVGLFPGLNQFMLRKWVGGVRSDIEIAPFKWQGNTHLYTLDLYVQGNRIRAFIDGEPLADVSDSSITAAGRIGLQLDIYTDTKFDDLIIVSPPYREGEYGAIISWDQAGSAVKIGLDGMVFPEGSIPAPKNEPVYVSTPFKAQTVKVIT